MSQSNLITSSGDGSIANPAVTSTQTKDDLLKVTSSTNPKEWLHSAVPKFSTDKAVIEYLTSCLPSVNMYVESLHQSWEKLEEHEKTCRLDVPCSWKCASEPPSNNIPVKFGELHPNQYDPDQFYSTSCDTLSEGDKLFQVAVRSSPPKGGYTFEEATTGLLMDDGRPLNIYNSDYPGIDDGEFFETYNGNMGVFDVLYMATDTHGHKLQETKEDKNSDKQRPLGCIAPGTKAADITTMTRSLFSQALAGCCFSQMHNAALGSPSPTCFLKIPVAQGQNAFVNFTDGWFSVVIDKSNDP